MDEKQFATLSGKLDTIITLLAIDRRQLNEGTKADAIFQLHEMGLDNPTIALVVNSTPGAVAVSLSKAKKAGQGGADGGHDGAG